MTTPAIHSVEEEEKLQELYLRMNELSKRRRKRNFFRLIATILVAVIANYIYTHYLVGFFQPDNYVPADTSIDLPRISSGIILCGLAIYLFYNYTMTRNPLMLLALPLIVILKASGALDNLMHVMSEINDKEYRNVQLIVENNAKLLPILPNYVNEKCEMTAKNYNRFTALSNALYADSFMAQLPRPKTVEEIKKMCILTVFRKQ